MPKDEKTEILEEEIESVKVESHIDNASFKDETETDVKAVKKVVKEKAVKRKKSGAKKVSEAILGEEPSNVRTYLFWDVLIPAIKDTLSDLVKRGIDALLFGDDKPRNINRDKNQSRYRYDNASYRNYATVSKSTQQRPAYNHRAAQRFDDILFRDRSDAEHVLDSLVDLTLQYGIATVADFYQLSGVEDSYIDQNFGWQDLGRARVVGVRGGYILDLPKPFRVEDDVPWN